MHLLQNTLRLSTIWLGCSQHGTPKKKNHYCATVCNKTRLQQTVMLQREKIHGQQIKEKDWNHKGLNFVDDLVWQVPIRCQSFFWHVKAVFDPGAHNPHVCISSALTQHVGTKAAPAHPAQHRQPFQQPRHCCWVRSRTWQEFCWKGSAGLWQSK